MTTSEVICSSSCIRDLMVATSVGNKLSRQFDSAVHTNSTCATFVGSNMKSVIFLMILYVEGTKANVLQDKSEIDPKEAFFRHLRQKSEPFESNQFHNIPLPGGLQFTEEGRLKRSYHVLPSAGLSTYFQIHILDDKLKHKRIKRQSNIFYSFQDANHNELKTTTENSNFLHKNTGKNHLIINDFIRFKRQSVDSANKKVEMENSRQKREPDGRNKKIIMTEREREARGATKEQWIKQPYPVERPMEDNVPSASTSDTIRAPRVHFVTTQRRGTEAQAPQVPQAHRPRMPDEREGRARDTHYHYNPWPRAYEPYRPRYYDPYYEHFDDRGRRYGFETFDDGSSMTMVPPPPPPPPPAPHHMKQRRIIYYATLPEVVRTPAPPGEQRYSYRSGLEYDGPGRYVHRPHLQLQTQRERDYAGGTSSSSSTSVASSTSTSAQKTPLYPVKVSTDVNVRESNKNPERRIYSEVDRRFTYKPPSFQAADSAHF